MLARQFGFGHRVRSVGLQAARRGCGASLNDRKWRGHRTRIDSPRANILVERKRAATVTLGRILISKLD